jgi:hypothetical protein
MKSLLVLMLVLFSVSAFATNMNLAHDDDTIVLKSGSTISLKPRVKVKVACEGGATSVPGMVCSIHNAPYNGLECSSIEYKYIICVGDVCPTCYTSFDSAADAIKKYRADGVCH